jgi:hypothetical protein
MSNPGAGYPWVSESIASEGIPLVAASAQRATSMVGNCAKRKFPVGPRHLIAKKSTSSQSILLLVQNGLSIFGSANLLYAIELIFYAKGGFSILLRFGA